MPWSFVQMAVRCARPRASPTATHGKLDQVRAPPAYKHCGCHCGAARYTLHDAPLSVQHCRLRPFGILTEVSLPAFLDLDTRTLLTNRAAVIDELPNGGE